MFESTIESLEQTLLDNIKLHNYDTVLKISETIKNIAEAENALNYLKAYGRNVGGAV